MADNSRERHYCPFQCGVSSSEILAIEFHLEDCPLNLGPGLEDSDLRARAHVGPPRPDWDEPFLPPTIANHTLQTGHEHPHQYHVDHRMPDASTTASTTPSSMRTTLETRSKRSSAVTTATSSTARPVSKTGTSLLDYVASSPHPRIPAEPRARKLREPRNPGRLGKKELGPHAFEKSMPADVRRHLLEDALPHYSYRIGNDGKLQRTVTIENETSNLIRVLSDLCALDEEIQVTYLCHPSVRHIHKLPCDGNFCGYWNIQMLLSYLQAMEAVPGGLQRTPDVLQIQNTIEQGWDNGLCAYGRVETGGIKGTRKWIGTHEAVTYFMQLGVPINALSFREDEKPKPHPDASNCISASASKPSLLSAAASSVSSSLLSHTSSALTPKVPKYSANDIAVIHFLDHVEAYFMSGLDGAKSHRTSFTTQLPPIYFQRQGHSTTIVGIERRKDGFRNLLVFDPSFATAGGMQKLLGGQRTVAKPEALLKPYRRTDRSLTAWNEFEIVVPRLPTDSTLHAAKEPAT